MKEKFIVSGMTCAACVAHVQKAVKNLKGTSNVNVNLLTGTLNLDIDENIINKDDIIKAIEATGYKTYYYSQSNSKKQEKTNLSGVQQDIKSLRNRFIFSLALTFPLMYVSMGNMWGVPMLNIIANNNNPIAFVLTQLLLTLPIVYINRSYFQKGYLSLLHGSPNMDSLVAIGSTAALCYGIFAMYMISYGISSNNSNIVARYSVDIYIESAAMILTLITLGKYFEAKSKGKTNKALKHLKNISPKTAIVEINGVEQEIPVEDVAVGDIVLIKPGGIVPIDGTVIEGNTSIDESAITGESMPIDKSPGSKVIQATINKSGFIKVKTEKVGDNTIFAEIIRLVEEASASKAPIAKIADKISGVFVPIVIIISIITAITWLISGQSFEFALSSAITVLVISCPCALGLATPVAIMVGTGKGAENGILIKSGEALEILHKVNCVVMDKTGTITEGKPKVTFIKAFGIEEKKLLQIAYSLEIKSEHPLGQAIVEYADYRGIKETIETTKFQAVEGKGVTAMIDNIQYFIGNKTLMHENNIDLNNIENEINTLNNNGNTTLLFASQNELIGIAGVADILKPDSQQAIAELKKLGIKVIMLTGDNSYTANRIAKELELDKVIAEVLPSDKEKEISNLKNKGKYVAMVGDGINDAPALVKADVGIAIGNGTDIAIQSADVVLINNNLLGVASAIKLSKSVIKNIKQNLFWAFFYNAIGIPLAAGVFYPTFGLKLTPVFGAAAMSLSSIFVITNALRLKTFKPYKYKNKKDCNIMSKTLLIEGMICQNCVKHIKNALKSIGVEGTINLETKTAVIENNNNLPEDTIIKAINDAGYEVKEIIK